MVLMEDFFRIRIYDASEDLRLRGYIAEERFYNKSLILYKVTR